MTTESQTHLFQLPILPTLLQWTLTITVPFLIVILAVRLIMTPLFLQVEYTRPDFPEDYYGFSTDNRIQYAPYAIEYLLNGADISFLGDLRFPDGKEMYNVRELQHMRDVKLVTQAALTAGIIIGLYWLIGGTILWRFYRNHFTIAAQNGALLTLALIVSIVIISVVSWDSFFTSFHKAFFADGTWRFEYSDTLIRLFPEQFWFDAALVIGAFSFGISILLLTLLRRMQK
jgi:integral membrane protein (TIGR01906 family)